MIGRLAFIIITGGIAFASPYTAAQGQYAPANRDINTSTSVHSSSSTLLFSLPSDLPSGEEDYDAFHAARAAVQTERVQPSEAAAASPTQPPKFPDDNTPPDSPASSDHNKVLVAIVGASTGGMVVLGAVGLFVWHAYQHRIMNPALPAAADDGTVAYDIPKFPESPPAPVAFSPQDDSSSGSSSSSCTDGDADNEHLSMISLSGEKEEEEESTAVAEEQLPITNLRRLSTIAEEKDHSKPTPATEDKPPANNFQASTLEEFAKVVEKYEDAKSPENASHSVDPLAASTTGTTAAKVTFEDMRHLHTASQSPDPDKVVVILDNPDTNASSSSSRYEPIVPSNNITIKTNDSLNNRTHKLLRFPPLVAHEQQQQRPLAMATSSPAISNHLMTASDITYSLRKLIHHPKRHMPPGERPQSLDDGSLVGQQKDLPVTTFDLPPTHFIPLENCPFQLVPRLSIMSDPEKRQGIHEVPTDTKE